jgi:hypothetical protein
MAEQYRDNATTTLNGAIDNATTTIVVTTGSVFSAVGDFHLKVDSEIMRATARVTNTITVVRAQEGTTAAPHNDLATITQILTAESLQRLGSQINLDGSWASRPTAAYANEGQLHLPNDGYSIAKSDGSAWAPWGPIFNFTSPIDSDFSWANQGLASVDVVRDAITLTAPAQGSGSLNYRVRYATAPATPWTLTVFLLHDVFDSTAFLKAGILFRQSSDGKLDIFEYEATAGGNVVIRNNRMATPTSNAGGGQIASTGNLEGLHPRWFRIGDNGVNRTFELSCDGRHWVRPWADVPRTTFLTADQIGFCCDAANNSGVALRDVNLTILHWKKAGQSSQIMSLKAKIS